MIVMVPVFGMLKYILRGYSGAEEQREKSKQVKPKLFTKKLS